MLTEKTFDTGVVKINYAEGAPSGPPLVMLHGISLWWQSFLPVIPALSFRYHVYALDFRGHGCSGRVPGAYQWGKYAYDTVQFLRQQSPEPAIILGHSLGAMVAMQVAAERPDLVRALVLEDPPLYSNRGEQLRMSPIYQRFVAWRDLIRTEYSVDEWTTVLADVQPPDTDAAALRFRAKSLSLLDPDVLSLTIDGSGTESYETDAFLCRISCPVLLLRGNPALGSAIEDADAERAAALLAQCTVVQVPDVGHGIHTPQPATFLQIVNNFLESL